MEAEREANEDVILIPCRNAQELVEVGVDDIPEDVSEVIDLLKVRTSAAPVRAVATRRSGLSPVPLSPHARDPVT